MTRIKDTQPGVLFLFNKTLFNELRCLYTFYLCIALRIN
jgi:hypothetical protein